MKYLKKISALVLALMMLTMGTCVFAASDTYTGDSQTTFTENTITLVKSIVFVNANGSSVYEPNISFSYTVTPATYTDTEPFVTDKNNNTAHVLKGVAGAISGTIISFSSENDAVTASAEGVEVEKTGDLAVDLSKFEHAGIYRYVIKEEPVDVAAKGLTARVSDAYTDTRYMDVYVKNGDNGLEMYGAVIFKSPQNGADDINKDFAKTTGFEPSDENNLKDDTDVDRYTTYDFTVKKAVAGALGDKTHEFPFYVSVSNTIAGAQYTYFADADAESGTPEHIETAAITKGSNSYASTVKLKDGKGIKFVGVPSSQTEDLAVVAKEFNDTSDGYTPTVTTTQGDISMVEGTAIDPDGSDSTESFSIKTNDVAGQIITITNTLNEISPTNVVMRFAPYLFILGGAIVLLAVSRRRKSERE